MSRILVTGGAGYIGATAVEMLLEQGHQISVLDDCSTGHAESLPSSVFFVEGSLLDRASIAHALAGCSAVIHFAGKSLVGESVVKPELYWSVNVIGSRNLLDEMRISRTTQLVFSSSAATYGEPQSVPIPETAPTKPTNAYGATKLAIDAMITDECRAHGLSAVSLRYFNVAGALKSPRGWLTERHDPETHLIPNVLKSTSENPVKIFGTDWPTADGTCVRDYVHVVDLIEAHIAALSAIDTGKISSGTHEIINLGSGHGYSVKEVLQAAGRALGREVPHLNSARRVGDPAVLIADISKAKSHLNWQPTRDINQMVEDAAQAALNPQLTKEVDI